VLEAAQVFEDVAPVFPRVEAERLFLVELVKAVTDDQPVVVRASGFPERCGDRIV
jgi:hypothetical protein